MKILVHIALAPKTPKIYARTITTLFNLDWGGRLDYLFARDDDPQGGKFADITAKHNRARELALNDAYDAVLFVENDMILPADALEKLLAVDADVVYGLYCARHGLSQWLCATELDMRRARWISEEPEFARAAWGTVVDSYGAGFGCTLVHRHVLRAIPFRLDGETGRADDWQFALDLRARGFRQAHHLGVVCGHIASREGGAHILWPDPQAEWLHTVEALDARQVMRATAAEPLVVNGNGFALMQAFREG